MGELRNDKMGDLSSLDAGVLLLNSVGHSWSAVAVRAIEPPRGHTIAAGVV